VSFERSQTRAGPLGLASQALLWIAALVTVTPFAWLAIAALKRSEDFFTTLFFPKGDGPLGIGWERLTADNFIRLISQAGMARSFVNSVFLSSVTALAATLVTAMAGYALAKFKFRGRGVVVGVVLAAIVLPPQLLLAPGYQLLYHMSLLDTFTGLILPAAAPAFGVYLFRQAVISSVPDAILESARMDGCGELRLFFQIVSPLIRPMTGTFLLITFVGTWNNFIGPQVVLQSPEKFPLSVAVAQLRGVYYQDYGLLMAGTVLSIAPVMALFLFLQRDFVSGLTSGAIKG
jgi:ABC-type glycerol-3-phosphate transport system permease component